MLLPIDQPSKLQVRTRVKICGITRMDDAALCCELGVDSIGLVFYEPSPRFIDLVGAREIRRLLPPFITVTALFLDASEEDVKSVIDEISPDCLQFHGKESPSFCEQWNKPYIKSIPMGEDVGPKQYAAQYENSSGFLLDSNLAGQRGGTGDLFDWKKIPTGFGSPLILAGGLSPENVAEAVTEVLPWSVDVSSGVEKSKGIKDHHKLKRFFSEVQRGDSIARAK